eukprot:TRINITY_DN38109_c0_g1_i1.p2 TRINITY_DN38109_c0_g1~~TRINITY_DN38109_c0_g1_i1.p2  ORF type:complete len:163 (-),score=47.40 TRINITY_DN38109_c0_g1_i1:206-694(-)
MFCCVANASSEGEVMQSAVPETASPMAIEEKKEETVTIPPKAEAKAPEPEPAKPAAKEEAAPPAPAAKEEPKAEEPAGPKLFTVKFEPGKIGLHISKKGGLIESVVAGGLAEKYNSTAAADQRIEKGDFLVKTNDFEGADAVTKVAEVARANAGMTLVFRKK